MMRVAPRYADIGDLQVAQHPLFFRTRPLEQLLELEENSPVRAALYLGEQVRSQTAADAYNGVRCSKYEPTPIVRLLFCSVRDSGR